MQDPAHHTSICSATTMWIATLVVALGAASFYTIYGRQWAAAQREFFFVVALTILIALAVAASILIWKVRRSVAGKAMIWASGIVAGGFLTAAVLVEVIRAKRNEQWIRNAIELKNAAREQNERAARAAGVEHTSSIEHQ